MMYYTFETNPPEDDCEYTKRNCLRKTDALFEPAEFIAPFTDKMPPPPRWSSLIDWDDHLDVNIVKETEILVSRMKQGKQKCNTTDVHWPRQLSLIYRNRKSTYGILTADYYHSSFYFDLHSSFILSQKFYSADYTESKHDLELLDKLKEYTTRQVTLIGKGLKIHKSKVPDSLQPLHDHMEQRFAEMCSLMEQQYHIKLQVKEILPVPHTNIRRYPSMPAVSGTRTDPIVSNQSEPGYSTLNHKRSPTVLKDKITPKRPMRPDPDRRQSRPPSTHFSPSQMSVLSTSNSSLVSNSSSVVTDTSDTDISDEPLPLPEKSSYGDYSNTPPESSATPMRKLNSQTLGRKSKPAPPLPVDSDNDSPPVLPDKPHTAHHNNDFSSYA
ncbi:hypothetical protein ScPMuIL_008538 [Solemya velum]